ncbi:acyl-CoA synthetase [Mangrovivirga cuniculi]|uniref:Long-chain fatty acid--CoA ligase n=1 Tax=Mangrovivirga cuniculi TaxID=2715131 RepID=A0A4D7JM67_9BACT|nr:acyl-CoA synthetase [Mangrovivirga cuniculi]QCK16681.1 long-chain fatty acid--CoA ligase [Mangrovivirga cuniculi]
MSSLFVENILNNRGTAIKGEPDLSYDDLRSGSEKMAEFLLSEKGNLKGKTVLSFLRPGEEYLYAMLGTWLAGGVFVPMPVSYPLSELAHYVKDSQSDILLTSFSDLKKELPDSFPFLQIGFVDRIVADKNIGHNQGVDIKEDDKALMIYTSGTTGKPKGVVHTFGSIKSQVDTLIEAWKWEKSDYIINPLPMHHIHGIVNITLCALTIGAKVEFFKFNKSELFDKLRKMGSTVFMAVPTIYRKLINEFESRDSKQQEDFTNACQSMRLMVSGSAALPISVLKRWEDISGHFLLERYGMSETGMVLSNEYEGERFEGMVGKPLNGIDVKIAVEEGEENTGELLVKGNQLFKEYWNKPEATANAFDQDGWFKTGDRVVVSENGVYKILGRYSVDILKVGGYKISAKDIEEVLRKHEFVKDAAVVGIPNEEYGEVIAAAIVFDDKHNEGKYLSMLKDYALLHLARHKIPQIWQRVEQLPQNAMGKVVKPEVKALIRQSLN